MKIALVHSFFYSGSGASNLVLHAAEELRARGHDVEVFTLGTSGEVEGDYTSLSFREWRTNRIKFLSFFDPLFLLANKFRVMPLLRALARRINGEFDVVVTSHYHLTPLLHFFLTKPCVYYCHEPPRQYYERFYGGGNAFRSIGWKIVHPLDFFYGVVDKVLDRFCVRKAGLVVSNSDYTRSRVRMIYGVNSVMVYPGVDAEFFRDAGLKRDILVSVGRLYRDLKGHRFVIRSLRHITGEKPALVVVGDGTGAERNALEKLALENGVSLDIKQSVSAEELRMLYSKARACLFGYVREPFGMAVLEAMSCGAPVVGVSEGGLAETITGDVGFLVPRDEDEFAQAVRFILDNPGRAIKMGSAGRRRVEEHFTWDRFGTELEAVLEGALKSGRGEK
ncbi:MAG: glycosyltransferase family 4 protein [Candidatus Altiarchaeota archaeon]